jgi:DNA (cytosine-5)-methyltransferase 1
LTREGFDASEDGTGRGTPVIAYSPEKAATLSAGQSSPGVSAPGRRQEDDHNLVAFHMKQNPISGPIVPALGRNSGGQGVAYVAEKVNALDTAQGGPDDNSAQPGHLVATYQKTTRPQTSDHPEVWEERRGDATLSPFDLGSETRAVELVLAPTLTAALGEGGWAGHNRKDEMVERTFEAGATVHRLTPIECERLQGFPDNWTVTSNGKPQSDSARYKQCGNAVAVPVFEWVAKRLAGVAS